MGFLSSLLPAVVGGAAVATMGPAALPWVAGGIGAAQALRTGNLGKGLMAGLSAYGGGNLGQALAQQGMEQAALNQAAQEMGLQTTGGVGSLADSSQFMKSGMWADPELTANMAAAPNVADTAKLAQYGEALKAAGYGTTPTGMAGLEAAGRGISSLGEAGGFSQLGQNLGGASGVAKTVGAIGIPALLSMQQNNVPVTPLDTSPGRRYAYQPGTTTPMPAPDVPGYGDMGQNFGRQQRYFTPGYRTISDEEAKGIYGFAAGGVPAIQGSPANGSIERMSNANAVGQNTGYPQAGIHQGAYATPWQTPVSENMLEGSADVGVNPISGEMNFAAGGLNMAGSYSRDLPDDLESAYSKAERLNNKPIMRAVKQEQSLRERLKNPQIYARGGLSDLGDYSDGGRLLRGPGDGVSDSIPAVIGRKQPARLADGEFVVPARIVSEIGNGSTEAGARKLYAMMDRVQNARSKTVGKGKVAKNTRADKYLPA